VWHFSDVGKSGGSWFALDRGETASEDLMPNDQQAASLPVERDKGGGDVSRRSVLTGMAAVGGGVAIAPLFTGCSNAGSPGESAPSSAAARPVDPGTVAITLNINGENYPLQIEPRVSLLDALRENIGLTGTKKGCDHGQCGACTVLIDNRRVNSCLTLAVMAAGQRVTTIEGVAAGEQLHPVQAAFIEHDAFQCGYCTPGQICSAVGLLNEGHARTDDDIREQMSGNICRCGAYPNIVDAVRQAIGQHA
jgi:xanthine dehydrogenase YagT iron-sulfur-binding subunit